MPSYHSTSSSYDRDQNTNDAESLKSEKLGKMPNVNHFLLPSMFLEVAILACLAVFGYYLRFTDVFDVFRRNYVCNDTELNYPYFNHDGVEDRVTVSVNDYELYIISALLPPLLFVLGEIIYKFCGPRTRKVISTLHDSFKVPLFVRRMFRFIGAFWLGYLLTAILTDSIKLLAGSPRPYLVNTPGYDMYIEHDILPNSTWCYLSKDLTKELRQALLSFPSFYATIAAYSATFAICYVQVILDFHGNYFLRPLLSAGLAGMALLAGYTRWMLYKNDWLDLLFGYIFGIMIAVYFAFGNLNGFKEHPDTVTHSRGQYGGDTYHGPDALEARPGFFRFLPRIRTDLMGPRRFSAYHGSVYGNSHAIDQNLRSNPSGYPPSTAGFIQPNSDFQNDLHNTVHNLDSSQQYEH